MRPLVDDASQDALSLQFLRLRKVGRLILYAQEGDEVRFVVRHRQVAKYSGRSIPVQIVSPSGDGILSQGAAFQEDTEILFKARETGIYRVTADPGANYAQILENTHPMSLCGEDVPVHLYATQGEFHFWVPAGTEEFGIRVYGDGLGEAVKATLIDPEGEIVEEVDNIAQTHQFEVALPEPSQGRAWTLRYAKPSEIPMEDYHVDLRGVPPLLSPSREALLIPVSE